MTDAVISLVGRSVLIIEAGAVLNVPHRVTFACLDVIGNRGQSLLHTMGQEVVPFVVTVRPSQVPQPGKRAMEGPGVFFVLLQLYS